MKTWSARSVRTARKAGPGWAVAVALAAMLGGAGGCARTALFYDTRELRHPALQANQKTAVLQTVEGKLGDRKVTWVDENGKAHDVTGVKLKTLGEAELGALWLATASGDVGGENDVRVHIGRGSQPVSVKIALDGSIVVESAPKSSGADDDGADPGSESDIRARFALERSLPGKWATAERRALASSLALLAPDELSVVQRVSFERAKRSGDPDRAALYQMRGCGAVIYLYPEGVASDRFRFVGDIKAPKSAVLHSIVHEIGHAYEQSMAREKYCAAEKAKNVERHNDLIRDGDALVDTNPVLAGYLAALAGDPAPTDYGNTSPHESFAESFALFHVDPAALERTRPRVYAWFAAGGPRKARGTVAGAARVVAVRE